MAYTVVNGRLVKAPKKNKYSEYGAVPEDYRPPKPIRTNQYEPPDPKTFPKDKGHYKGACNRSICLKYPATWYNRGSYAFYCVDCGHLLNHDNRHDEFCKDEPLCKFIENAELAKDCYVTR